MPLTVERFPAQAVYDKAAEDLAAHLSAGRDVAVLCEGDPFFYGSFMYLFGRLAEKFPIEVVPGVSSRSEEHTSELQSLMRISYAVFCLKKKKKKHNTIKHQTPIV